jgi:flavin reductase (DIM6/NTAB) family NADH-FMN oxidoreductase RutF
VIPGFKDALACWASGVAVVAAAADGLVYGLTVSSFASLSLDPPLVLACVASKNRLPPMVRASRRFTVSFLAADQGDISTQYARSGREPIPSTDPPIVPDAIAYLHCELHADLGLGDHTILVGRVVEAIAQPDRDPLVYFRRGYCALRNA